MAIEIGYNPTNPRGIGLLEEQMIWMKEVISSKHILKNKETV